jgi:hypothetical protein
MSNSLSIFANALASENLSFSFDPEADTASFDTKTRHLIMPVWDVSETVQTMLIAHEISHALWTPYERSEELLNAAEAEGYHKGLLQRIANMVEDARIEKLMKAKFPGTRRDFYLGYKEIVDKDMFSFSKMDIPNAGLVNRLNLHFKWGIPGFLAVNLTPDEQIVADEVDAVKTFEDTIEVAKRLYKHPSMNEVVKQVEQQMQGNGKGEGEEMLDSVLKNTDLKGTGKKNGEDYNASTVTITGLKDYRNGIISTDMIRQSFTNNTHPDNIAASLTQYREFVRESDAFVRQMVAQFERKKAADEIRRERPKQTGMLNLDRLHQYRTHDDIFISKIVKQDGKNHGIVFLLDFSGSMGHTLGDCYLQILQLVWFCEKAKIPFDVFAFTDVHPCHIHGEEWYRARERFYANPANEGKHFSGEVMDLKRDCPTAIHYNHAKLLHLASSNDKPQEREQLLAMLHGSLVANLPIGCPLLRMGGTPTVEALAIASEYMKEWVVNNNIQIPTIMVVTDGQPNGVEVADAGKAQLYYRATNASLTVVNEIMGTVERVMGESCPNLCIGNMVVGTMLNSLRAKLNARCVGMFVGGNSLHPNQFVNFCMNNEERMVFYKNHHRMDITQSPRFAAAKESYKDGCVIVHPDTFPGYDSYFLTKTPKVVKDEEAIMESGTFTKIKNTFIRTMAKRGVSRVFLTRYVDIVAGQPIKAVMDAIYTHSVMPAKK